MSKSSKSWGHYLTQWLTVPYCTKNVWWSINTRIWKTLLQISRPFFRLASSFLQGSWRLSSRQWSKIRRQRGCRHRINWRRKLKFKRNINSLLNRCYWRCLCLSLLRLQSLSTRYRSEKSLGLCQLSLTRIQLVYSPRSQLSRSIAQMIINGTCPIWLLSWSPHLPLRVSMNLELVMAQKKHQRSRLWFLQAVVFTRAPWQHLSTILQRPSTSCPPRISRQLKSVTGWWMTDSSPLSLSITHSFLST